jgi:hypothetical protein
MIIRVKGVVDGNNTFCCQVFTKIKDFCSS